MNEQNNNVEQVPTKAVQQSTKLPLFIVIAILLAVVGVVSYNFGTKAGKESNNKQNGTETSTPVPEKTEEDKKDEEPTEEEDNNNNKDETPEDTDKNGQEIKTKNITLNGNTYELKIEVVKDDDLYYQNVYFNGHKFIDYDLIIKNMVTTVEPEERVYERVEEELANTKTIKDISNNDEYFIFDEPGQTYDNLYQYIMNPKGEIIAKILKSEIGAGFYIMSNNIPDKKYNYVKCEDACEATYYVYHHEDGLIQNYENYILFIPLQNAYATQEEIKKQRYQDTVDYTNITLQENKLTISNGKAVVEKSTLFKGSEGYIFTGAGAWLELNEYALKGVIKPAE